MRRAASSPAMPLTVVILAAGQGKRMNSDLPKVLQPLAGRPLLKHVIATARSLQPEHIHVVYGHGGERVPEALREEPVSWVLQAEQLGTGHALLQVAPQLTDGHLVLVLYGDVPLIGLDTLKELLRRGGAKAVGLLTVLLEDPTGYGRVLRDKRGRVRAIVEQKEASARQLAVRECNTGVLVAPAARLKKWLARLKNDNAQREYYLTDVIALAVKEKTAVEPLVASAASVYPQLLVGRVLQGFGGAGLLTIGLAIVSANFTGAARARGLGYYFAAGATAAVVGPLVGGVLASSAGWSAIFWVQIPLALVVMGMAFRVVPASSETADRSLDLPGLALASLALRANSSSATMSPSSSLTVLGMLTSSTTRSSRPGFGKGV